MKSFSKLLPISYYLSENVDELAQSLLGKILVSYKDGLVAGIIVETEAYRAPDDKACHAYGNKFTNRTARMFGRGGKAYVYKCYGIHDMINVVTAPEGIAHAVLIRAIEPIQGIDLIQERRGISKNNHLLTGGPGKVCVSLGINVEDDGASFWDKNSKIQIRDGKSINSREIISGPRVGMSRLTGVCSNWPWRFYIKGNKWVSKPLNVKYSW